MGLIPSRESLHQAATAPDAALPYISRPVESYVYKTNRTERTFGSGVPGIVTGVTPLPAALPNTTMAVLHGSPALELAQKLSTELPDAVFIDDPAEASAAVAAAVAATRPTRRNVGGQKGKSAAGDVAGSAEESSATQALRAGKAPFVYYYEHRVLPLTKEFFPSPDCILFQQLWHARQQQNPRYHFQLDQTWSPGALMDPTAHYESFLQLAASSLTDIQAACLTGGGAAITRGGVLQAQSELEAAKAELSASDDVASAVGGPGGKFSGASPVPFATREEFYNLVVRTTEESMLYDSDEALRQAVQHAGEAHPSEGDATTPCKRIRPVPCAIALVRRCMPAQEYRYTYYLASHERHHRTTEGNSNSSSSAATGADAGNGGAAGLKGGAQAKRRVPDPTRRDVQTIAVTGSAVRAAVEEAQSVLRARTGGKAAAVGSDGGEESLMVPWLQVSVPQAPLDLAELRVVGMYGCWTMEEILRHSLFLPSAAATAPSGGLTGSKNSTFNKGQGREEDAAVQAKIDAILRRACPHGVPSSTLLNVGFFEKQVGDKEQCHTYFSLCRLFAHGMRACILRDVIAAASASALETTLGGDDTGESVMDVELERERAEAELRELRRQQQHPTWQKFLKLLSGDCTSSSSRSNSDGQTAQNSLFADLSNCFLIRFSYVPQLQLCRQLRLLLSGMASMYPEPISLEAFQAAQRQRNMAAMAKKQTPTALPSTESAAATAAAADAAVGPIRDFARASPSLPANSATRGTIGGEARGNNSNNNAAVSALPGGAGLSLDPDAIAERSQSEHPSELQRLHVDGFCCYASNGLVVFRISRGCVARALNQLGFASMKDSIEALCVTLTAAAPPPLTYRGELRPPSGLPSSTGMMGGVVGRSSQSWTPPLRRSGPQRDDGDTVNCDEDEAEAGAEGSAHAPGSATATSNFTGAGVADALDADVSPVSPDLTMAAVRDLYCNAVRYSSDPASGFAALRLFNSTANNSPSGNTTAAGAPGSPSLHKAVSLEQTPDALIGVLPRNPIEQRRGRLLPLRGLLLQEARVNSLHNSIDMSNGGSGGGAAAAVNAAVLSQTKASMLSSQQLLAKVSELHQFDVYTVSEELDGVPFRRLVEMAHQVEQQRHAACSATGEEWPEVFIEAVDAQGNAEPDSVLNWSPMAALGRRARGAQLGESAEVPSRSEGGLYDETDNGGESTTPVYLSQTLHSALSTQSSLGGKLPATRVPIRVHDPDRVLHTGDRIRFAPCTNLYSTSNSPRHHGARGEATGPNSTSAEFLSPHSTPATSPHRRSRKSSGTGGGGGSAAAASMAAAARCGYWYVDDVLTTEDMVLSWMRRVSGRARETRGNDTKWVRYPSPMLTVLLQFVRVCRQKPSGSWLNTGHPLRLLHPMDDELVESDMLQNFPGIVRTRRFRQWRFSHDGYVYFHGVTVRMPGSAPPLQATPLPLPKPLATMTVASEAMKTSNSNNNSNSNSKGSPRDDVRRERHVDVMANADAASISTAQSTPPAPLQQQHQQQQQQQQFQQQQQQQQQIAFTGVPRPPPVMQPNVYGVNTAQMEGGYGNCSPTPYPNTVYVQNNSSNTNHNGTPPQQMVYQTTQFNPSMPPGVPQQLQYQQLQQQPQQAYFYTTAMNMNGAGMPFQQQQPQQQQQQQQQQPTSLTMYVPVTYTVEPCYVQQAAPNLVTIPQPPTNVAVMPTSPNPFTTNVNSNSNSNALYFNEANMSNMQGPNASANSVHNGSNNNPDGVGSLRSPGGVSQHMHFSLQHMDSTNSLRSYDRTASNAMLGPTHVTGSFYGEFYGQSPQQQQQQQSHQQLTSPSNTSVHSTGDYRNEGWLSSGPHPSQGTQTPDGSALTSTPKQQDAQSHQATPFNAEKAAAERRGSTSAAGTPQPYTPSSVQGGKVPLSPNPQQQPQRYAPTGRPSAIPSSNASRRSTADYPPRRVGGAAFLAGGGTSPTTMVHPTVQRAVSRPIQTAHVDAAKREIATIAKESGAPLRLPIPKSRMMAGHTLAGVQTPLTPIQQHQQLQQQQQQQQQQQTSALTSPQLSSTAGSFREGGLPPSLSTGAADVMESDGITVHVMQRKPSIRRVIPPATAASTAAGGVTLRSPVSAQPLGRLSSYHSSVSLSGSPQQQQQQQGGDGNYPDAGNASPSTPAAAAAAAAAAYYGATGVSPTGGVDASHSHSSNSSTTPAAAANAAAAAATGTEGSDGAGGVMMTLPDDAARAALAQLTYEMPAVMTPTATGTSQANSFVSGGQAIGGGAANRSTSRIAVGGSAGVTTPPQRHRSLRVSHNPYATRDVTVVAHGAAGVSTGTPATTPIAAHASYHSHMGGGGVGNNSVNMGGSEGHRLHSGQDSFQAALDAQYGGENDFGAGIPGGNATTHALTSPPNAPVRKASAMAHGVLYGRSGTSITAEAQEKHNSFYAAAADNNDEEPAQSYSSHEMYRDKIADGTTQGFYYSMDGPDEQDGGNAAHQLYGRDDNGGVNGGGGGNGLYAAGQRHDGSFTHAGSTPYGNIPAPPALHRSQRGSY